MRHTMILAALILSLAFVTSCGKDSCFSVGPIGDCATKYPSDTRGTTTGGALKAYGADNLTNISAGGKLEIKVEGGVRPYKLRVESGQGTMTDAAGAATADLSGTWLHANAAASVGSIITIRINDSSATGETKLAITVK